MLHTNTFPRRPLTAERVVAYFFKFISAFSLLSALHMPQIGKFSNITSFPVNSLSRARAHVSSGIQARSGDECANLGEIYACVRARSYYTCEMRTPRYVDTDGYRTVTRRILFFFYPSRKDAAPPSEFHVRASGFSSLARESN